MPAHQHFSRLFALFFFFNDTATTEIYTLSLHDALPISACAASAACSAAFPAGSTTTLLRRVQYAVPSDAGGGNPQKDRKSTRLNSSHQIISHSAFCLQKKKN